MCAGPAAPRSRAAPTLLLLRSFTLLCLLLLLFPQVPLACLLLLLPSPSFLSVPTHPRVLRLSVAFLLAPHAFLLSQFLLPLRLLSPLLLLLQSVLASCLEVCLLSLRIVPVPRRGLPLLALLHLSLSALLPSLLLQLLVS